jgi:hypothetical protein
VNADSGKFNDFHNKILPFTSDGCSKFPDSFGQMDWGNCCKKHNFAYWKCGTAEEKAQADESLNKCVQENAGAALGALMEAGVMVRGIAGLPTSWRWGYGWVVNRGYKPLGGSELVQVEQLTPENLTEVEVSSASTILIRQSITGNYCLDIALSEIGDAQGKETVMFQVVDESNVSNQEGTIKSFEIRTDKCAEPYQVNFLLLKPHACDARVNELVAMGRVRLKSLSFGCESLNFLY